MAISSGARGVGLVNVKHERGNRHLDLFSLARNHHLHSDPVHLRNLDATTTPSGPTSIEIVMLELVRTGILNLATMPHAAILGLNLPVPSNAGHIHDRSLILSRGSVGLTRFQIPSAAPIP